MLARANVGPSIDLLGAVSEAVGRTLDPTFEAVRPGDVRDSQADISLAANRLGYRAEVDLREGIRRSVAWYSDLATNAATAG